MLPVVFWMVALTMPLSRVQFGPVSATVTGELTSDVATTTPAGVWP